MLERKVMSRLETFEFISHVGNAVIGGVEPPHARPGEMMLTEDMGDAMDAWLRSLAGRFDKAADESTEDPEVREALRIINDKMMSDAALGVRTYLAGLQIKGGGA